MVLLPARWSLVIINASRMSVEVLGYPKRSAAELLDGTLKLRYCSTMFSNCFSLGLYLGSEMVVVKGAVSLLVICWMKAVTMVRVSG